MPNIGWVYKSSYYNKKKEQNEETIILDLRTISTRKQITVSVNRLKYPDGNVRGAISPGKEDHPDYHLWANFSNRGESLPSVIIGNMKNHTSEDGNTHYKRGKIFDPFVRDGWIYFTLFATAPEKKITPEHLFDVVAEPYRPNTNTGNANSGGNGGYAAPSYQDNDMWAGADGSMTTESGRSVPVHTAPPEAHGVAPGVDDPINEDEIPF